MKTTLKVAVVIVTVVVVLLGIGAYETRNDGAPTQQLEQVQAQATESQAKLVDAEQTQACLQQKAQGLWLTKDCQERIKKLHDAR